MFSQTDLDRLIDAMRANAVTSLEVEAQGDTLKLDLAAVQSHDAPASVAAPVPSKTAQNLTAKSPCIGRFVPRGDDDGLDALAPATTVAAGDTLGYIVQNQARALIIAPNAGTVIGDTPPTGTVFGYGDVVFQLEVIA